MGGLFRLGDDAEVHVVDTASKTSRRRSNRRQCLAIESGLCDLGLRQKRNRPMATISICLAAYIAWAMIGTWMRVRDTFIPDDAG